MHRSNTRQVHVKDIVIGGNNHVFMQSMTTTKTKDLDATVKQIKELELQGCELIRVAVLDMEDARTLGKIKREMHVPLVADIHYDYLLALEAINQGVDKLRLNPANIKDKAKIKQVVLAAKEKQIPIRIGVNAGGFKDHSDVVGSMMQYAEENITLLEELDFRDIVLSFKSSDLEHTLRVNRLASEKWEYPLHIGMTEAGTAFGGGIKNAIGIGILLSEGIGNTIRVSITADPVEELKVCKEILKNFGLYDAPTIVSCPTCGRLQYEMIDIVNEVEKRIAHLDTKLQIAIMGCSVNGPGEARQADIGIAGGIGEVLLFKEGKVIKKIPEKDAVEILVAEIESMVNQSK